MSIKKLAVRILAASMIMGCMGAATTAMAEEQRTLTVLSVYDESKVELYEMFDKFREDHPDVDLQITAITSSADLNKQLTTLAVSGDLPDMAFIDRMYIAQFVSMGIIEDVTERVETDIDNLDTYYPGPLDGCMVDGKYYGLPLTSNCLAVYYNKNILEANGVEIPEAGWTWDDYAKVAEACVDPDNSINGCIMAGPRTVHSSSILGCGLQAAIL